MRFAVAFGLGVLSCSSSSGLVSTPPKVDCSGERGAIRCGQGTTSVGGGASGFDEPMVEVPAGTFLRGHAPSERTDEWPPHSVRMRTFRIDRTLVTRAAFGRFVAETGYKTSVELGGLAMAAREGMADWEWHRVPRGSWRRPFLEPEAHHGGEGGPEAGGATDSETEAAPDVATYEADTSTFLRDDAPVVMVSWFDAQAYCAHVGKRLPTEAEWEYAMRAGASGTRYPWGDGPERDGALSLNFWQGVSHRHNLREDGFVYVSPVKAFPPNAWGVYDPVGNVWQWTADWYSPDTYKRAAEQGETFHPVGPDGGKTKVLRGGSWWCGACTCEGNGLHYRGKATPLAAFNNNGFRCAAD